MIISTWEILLWLHVLYSRLCLGPVCHYHPLHASLLTVHVMSCSSVFVCGGRQRDAFIPDRSASEGLPRLKCLLLHQPHILVSYEGTTPWALTAQIKQLTAANRIAHHETALTCSFLLMCIIWTHLRKQTCVICKYIGNTFFQPITISMLAIKHRD